MSTTVIINDHVNNRRAHLIFSNNDFGVMAQFWEDSDKLLRELQAHRLFLGRTKWCDLDPIHFRVLLIQNLCAADELSDDQLSDDDDPIVRSINFLVMAFVYCLAKRIDGEIEVMRIHRLNKTDITYDISAVLLQLNIDNEDETETETPTPTFSPGFRVVVDNTNSKADV